MLTRDLLVFRTRNGRVTPTFIDTSSPELLALAEALTQIPAAGAGVERGTLEERAEERATGFPQPKVAAGLIKLLFDRITFEEPTENAALLRQRSFDAAARVLRELPEGSSVESFESALALAIPEPLERVRSQLFADHPDNRRMLEWDALTARELLERYNLAQVQGLILRSKRISLRATAPELLRVRRLLRWMKFCRLVADVQSTEPDLVLDVEGPAAVLSMEKKYGLQLAQFVAMVPILQRFELRAEIAMDRRPPSLLVLDESAGLAAPKQPLGFTPQEIAVILEKLRDGPWEVEASPAPRPVGAGGICVPDIAFRAGAAELAIEFFHPWHRHALGRRLSDVRTRPDASLVLAIDEKLLGDETLREAVERYGQAVLFRGFPSERALRKLLEGRLGSSRV